MALRLVEYSPPEDFELPQDAEVGWQIVGRSRLRTEDGRLIERVLMDTKQTEAFIEWLYPRIAPTDDQRIFLLKVEAAIPEVKLEEEQTERQASNESSTNGRISREELLQDVRGAIDTSGVYYWLVVLSTVVAAGGMLTSSVAVVIGAMVIAPLIGPNMALALGTTLGDTDLLRRALQVNLRGLLLAFGLSVAAGLLFPVDLTLPEIASRTSVGLGDLFLALAAGVAGALSLTRGISTALIGVMVAVALLPPLVALGLFVGEGYWIAAYGAFLLLLTNVVSVNLAGVCTFLAQGIRPMNWYDATQAKRSTRLAITLWIAALALLATAISLAPGLDLTDPKP